MAGIRRRANRKMVRQPLLARGFAVLSVLMLIAAAYVYLYRPYQLHWGATSAEIEQSMPGDGLNTNPSFLATRAITIDAPPEKVWPWLLQMGYGRAGFYGYDLLENAGSPEGMRSADEIIPRFQKFVVGDEVPISAVASMTFHSIEPYHYLIWLGSDTPNPGAFTWAVYPRDGDRTRLLSRIRWTYHPTSLTIFSLEVFTEFADHIAVRKILQGIKQRVEGNIEPMWVQNIEFFTFLCTFLTFFAALVLLCWRRLTWWSWGAGLFAGMIWLANWYAPIPTWSGILLVLLAIGALFETRRAGLSTGFAEE